MKIFLQDKRRDDLLYRPILAPDLNYRSDEIFEKVKIQENPPEKLGRVGKVPKIKT